LGGGWRRGNLAVGAVLVGVVVLAAGLAPVVAGADPYAQDLMHILLPPSGAHPFGTDAYGRDILARVVYGARISLL